ncbi:uncharacterized protein LOC144025434 [Festucalex cinctus]
MSGSERKSLVWYIRKSLLALTAEELFQIAKDVGPVSGRDVSEFSGEDHEACFDHISSFLYNVSGNKDSSSVAVAMAAVLSTLWGRPTGPTGPPVLITAKLK